MTEPKPMDPDRLALARALAGVDSHPDGSEALMQSHRDLLADRDHWHDTYQEGLAANVELCAEIKRLNGEAMSGSSVASATVVRDLWHGGTPTAETYFVRGLDENPTMSGCSLSKLFPTLELGHGTVFRVVVELVDPGTPCPVMAWRDGETCTDPDA